MRGLKGVYVLVEPLALAAREHGLHEITMQRDVELKLQQAGIEVLTQTVPTESAWPQPARHAARLAERAGPQIDIHVCTRSPYTVVELYVYHVEVKLKQWVTLERDPSIRSFAATWSSQGAHGSLGRAHLEDSVRRSINEELDEFIKTYLSLNPK